jgi:hypothetical protein
MRRVFRDIKPNHKALAKLYKDGHIVAEVPCQVWFPRHDYERPFLLFESIDPAHKSIGVISPNYDVSINIAGLDEREVTVYAHRMFVENFSMFCQSPALPTLITFEGEPQAVTEMINVGQPGESNRKSHYVLSLMDNFLLSPDKIVERSLTGEVKVEEVRFHKDFIEKLGEVTFDKHYYYVGLKDGGEASYRKLVAVFDTDIRIKDLSSFEEIIRPLIDDYLLLVSFAANQRTNVLGWISSDGEFLLRGWYGNVEVGTQNRERRHSHADVLIDIIDFQEFMRVATSAFSRFNADEKQVLRQAIYNILPRHGKTVESCILSYFSAIESVVLLHRRDRDLEFTVSKKHWEKLEKSLRKAVREHESLFTTPEHMEMLIKMLPSLKRVPLQEAFCSFVNESKVDLTDLWPLFGPANGATLSDVRNRLIHGDSFNGEQFTSLCHAMDNLECTAKRLIVSILGWDVAMSNISKRVLSVGGWISNSKLSEDMQALSTT